MYCLQPSCLPVLIFLQPAAKLVQSFRLIFSFVAVAELQLLFAAFLELFTAIRNVSLQLLTRKETTVHQSYTRSGSFGITEAHRRDTIRFFVEKYHVGDFTDLGAFVANILFDVEKGGRILLVNGQGNALQKHGKKTGG